MNIIKTRSYIKEDTLSLAEPPSRRRRWKWRLCVSILCSIKNCYVL